MEDILSGDHWHVINLILLLAYVLVKELYLDRNNLKKELSDVKEQKGPLKALELDLGRISQKVINLEDAIGDQAEVLGAKLDMILEDFKEKHTENKEGLEKITAAVNILSNRLVAVETELKMKRRQR